MGVRSRQLAVGSWQEEAYGAGHRALKVSSNKSPAKRDLGVNIGVGSPGYLNSAGSVDRVPFLKATTNAWLWPDDRHTF